MIWFRIKSWARQVRYILLGDGKSSCITMRIAEIAARPPSSGGSEPIRRFPPPPPPDKNASQKRALAKAIDDWVSAKARLEAGDYIGTEFAARLSVDNALDKVSAVARAMVEPQASIALMLSGFQLAKDTYYTDGRDELDVRLEMIKRDLQASACQCAGEGEIIKGHPGDPASAVPCPDCREGDAQ